MVKAILFRNYASYFKQWDLENLLEIEHLYNLSAFTSQALS